MADVAITLRIMPTSPQEDLDGIIEKARALVEGFGGKVHTSTKKPVAFGLEAIEILFIMDEGKGSTEELEKQISGLPGVSSVDVVDVRRAIG
ncbi:elongation factor 1-beta [Candidatus Woesearchaeota archaeon]|nr:MAG: elongation factor 1-beta [Candidatus Woesearchaeota archaeon]